MADGEYGILENKIKRLRKLADKGKEHLRFLSEAPLRYERRGRISEKKADSYLDDSYSVIDPESAYAYDERSRVGLLVEVTTGSFKKIDSWLNQASSELLELLDDKEFNESTEILNSFPTLHRRDQKTANPYLDEYRNHIESRLKVINDALLRLGVFDDPSPTLRDGAGGWPHLRGLLEDSMIDGKLAVMRKRGTRSEMSDAIGAAKELLEASLKAIANELQLSPKSSQPTLQDWWRTVRPHVGDDQADGALQNTGGALQRLLQNQVSTVQSLGELRNRVGSGHGQHSLPKGLEPAHALLAVDTVHTVTRFLVMAKKKL